MQGQKNAKKNSTALLPKTVPIHCLLFHSICNSTPTHLGTCYIKLTVEQALKAQRVVEV